MAKFKVGDRVRVTGCTSSEYVGSVGTVENVDDTWAGETDFLLRVRLHDGELRWCSGVLVGAESNKASEDNVRFVLQYELGEDPFETFATMKEVEARIKELSHRSDLKRESIKVYEIAKTYDVSLQTRVIFNGLLGPKVKMEERVEEKIKKPAKRGPHFKCPDCGGKFKNRRGLGIHRGRAHGNT